MFTNFTLSIRSDVPQNMDGRPSDNSSWIQNIHLEQLLHDHADIFTSYCLRACLY